MKKNEKGFALILALVLLLVMSLMGGALIVISSGDHENNNSSDEFQQTFYVAETALREGEQWLLDRYLGPWSANTNARDTANKGLPDNRTTNWDGKMGVASSRNNYDTNSSFFYNTNDICYNSFGDLPKPIKVAHAESNNYGELLLRSFGSTSADEKKEAEYLQRYFYEFFVIRIGSASFRGFGSSVKKTANNNASDGMAYRIFACGIFNADNVTNSNNSKKRVVVPLESIVVLPK
jgi:type II secretory pathway pseudopilin PulG